MGGVGSWNYSGRECLAGSVCIERWEGGKAQNHVDQRGRAFQSEQPVQMS